MSEESHNEKIIAIKQALKERDAVRTKGNFGKADVLRGRLLKKYSNIDIIDQPNGPSGFRFLDGTSNKLDNAAPIPAAASAEKKRGREEEEDEAPECLPTVTKKSRKAEDTAAKKSTDEKKASGSKKPSSAEQSRNASLMSSMMSSASANRTVQGVVIEELAIGTGKQAKSGRRIKVHYVGKLVTGKVFDSSTKKPFAFRLGGGEVIRGWDIGCDGMLVGGKRRLTIPPEKAYGRAGAPPTIPPNSTLVFDVTLLDVV